MIVEMKFKIKSHPMISTQVGGPHVCTGCIAFDEQSQKVHQKLCGALPNCTRNDIVWKPVDE